MQYDMRTMKAFGLHTSNRPASPEKSAGVGLHTLVYRSPEDAYVQNIGPDGRFLGFAPFRPCTADDYSPAHLPTFLLRVVNPTIAVIAIPPSRRFPAQQTHPAATTIKMFYYSGCFDRGDGAFPQFG